MMSLFTMNMLRSPSEFPPLDQISQGLSTANSLLIESPRFSLRGIGCVSFLVVAEVVAGKRVDLVHVFHHGELPVLITTIADGTDELTPI